MSQDVSEGQAGALVESTVTLPVIRPERVPQRRRHRPYMAWMMSGVGLAWALLALRVALQVLLGV